MIETLAVGCVLQLCLCGGVAVVRTPCSASGPRVAVALTDGGENAGEAEIVHGVQTQQVKEELLLLLLTAQECIALIQLPVETRTHSTHHITQLTTYTHRGILTNGLKPSHKSIHYMLLHKCRAHNVLVWKLCL